jgi:hypothetical protein
VIPRPRRHATRITDWHMEPTAPVWSPDGKRIAFQNYAPEGNYHIWTIDPDGATCGRVTTGPYDDREPAWTPGRQRAWCSRRTAATTASTRSGACRWRPAERR